MSYLFRNYILSFIYFHLFSVIVYSQYLIYIIKSNVSVYCLGISSYLCTWNIFCLLKAAEGIIPKRSVSSNQCSLILYVCVVIANAWRSFCEFTYINKMTTKAHKCMCVFLHTDTVWPSMDCVLFRLTSIFLVRTWRNH